MHSPINSTRRRPVAVTVNSFGARKFCVVSANGSLGAGARLREARFDSSDLRLTALADDYAGLVATRAPTAIRGGSLKYTMNSTATTAAITAGTVQMASHWCL